MKRSTAPTSTERRLATVSVMNRILTGNVRIRDWRFWVGFVLMFAAITIYVMSDDLSLLPRRQPPLSDGARR